MPAEIERIDFEPYKKPIRVWIDLIKLEDSDIKIIEEVMDKYCLAGRSCSKGIVPLSEDGIKAKMIVYRGYPFIIFGGWHYGTITIVKDEKMVWIHSSLPKKKSLYVTRDIVEKLKPNMSDEIRETYKTLESKLK